VRFIDKALKHVFENFNINPKKVCCAGFSDGASVRQSSAVCPGLSCLNIVSSQQKYPRCIQGSVFSICTPWRHFYTHFLTWNSCRLPYRTQVQTQSIPTAARLCSTLSASVFQMVDQETGKISSTGLSHTSWLCHPVLCALPLWYVQVF